MEKDILKLLGAPLKIEDVDFRIQSINNGGYATILAYKDARVDMNRLDSVCGVNWQKDFKIVDGNLFCGVAIKVDNEWVWRFDVGTESFSDKEKGQASDAFKRACFNWGIGRELYNYPVIQIKLLENEFKMDNGKPKQTFNLKIKEWVWSSKFDAQGNIIELSCLDNKGNKRYNWNANITHTEVEDKTDYEQLLKDCKTLSELSELWGKIPAGTGKTRLGVLKEELKNTLM